MRTALLWIAGLLSVEAPPLAVVLDSTSYRLTRVYGLAGNFVRGEAGEELLAYSFDGEIEWRLEPGRLVARRGGIEAILATQSETAVFRGATARLADGRIVALDEDRLVDVEVLSHRIAGRAIAWSGGELIVTQPDGTEERIPCATEPAGLTAAGPDWAHFEGRLLRLTAGRVALYHLPERSRRQ